MKIKCSNALILFSFLPNQRVVWSVEEPQSPDTFLLLSTLVSPSTNKKRKKRFGLSSIDSLKQTVRAVYTSGALSDQNQQQSKDVSEGAVIFDCHACRNNLAGKQCFLSDRQSGEITKTSRSGGSFITTYPSAWPAPSFLFFSPLFTKALQKLCAPRL